ncbi:MAG: STAS/SEC14 domain-containing protein [Methanomicrobiaceae archaeon]|nr:STAS/SEC14 domain-containing protein [Methanomicrobiaceae archaeon]
MIDELPGSSGDILGFRFCGEITDEDYSLVFLPALLGAIEEYGTIRLMVDVIDYKGEDIAAMDDDIRENFRLVHIERQAIVGSEDLRDELNRVDTFFLFPNTDVRFFGADQRRDAWRWLREGMRPKTGVQAPPPRQH